MRIKDVGDENAVTAVWESKDAAESTLNFSSGSRDYGGCSGFRRHHWWLLAGALVLVLVVAAVVVATTLSSGPSADHHRKPTSRPHSQQFPKHPPPNPDFILDDERHIIRSFEWNDVPPKYVRPLHHPTPYVVIGHTASASTCVGEEECFANLRNYRDAHRSDWDQPDIVYNFLIDVAGNVYEGRGWDATNNYQSWAMRCNLAITFLGDFMIANVTERMAESLRLLLELGVRTGKLAKDYRLVAQNQLMATLSPGKNLLWLIKYWDHRCLSACDVGVECIYIEPTTTYKGNSSTVAPNTPLGHRSLSAVPVS